MTTTFDERTAASMTLRDLLGIRFPVIQAPMAGAQDGNLAAAVSGAGGLGSLPCAMLDVDGIRAQLDLIALQTGNPVNVNFFCHTPPQADPERERRWRAALAPYYQEFGIDAQSIPAASGREPFSEAVAGLLDEFKPAVVSFHFGLPAQALLERVRRMGAKIFASATTVNEARWLEAKGVDAIIAQGLEAGGHRGSFLSADLTLQMGTFALLPQIVKTVSVPVIAAGGIADNPGVRAAMTLGAAGVQVGTAYLLCPETTISLLHRRALKQPGARETALTNLFTGRPARGIVNRIMREIGPLSDAPPEFPLATAAMAPLRKIAESAGNADFSPLWAGQNTSGCKQISAAELTRELGRGV